MKSDFQYFIFITFISIFFSNAFHIVLQILKDEFIHKFQNQLI